MPEKRNGRSLLMNCERGKANTMLQLPFRMKSNGMPIASGEELDEYGEHLLADFSSYLLTAPQEIDIDRFVTRYLHMQQDFQYLSHCGVYLGMTVFQTTNYIPVFCPETGLAEYASASAGTIIVDNSLMDESQEHRYRFTVGHEGSHSILHPSYFLNSIGAANEVSIPYMRCRADFALSASDFANQSPILWTEERRAEQQANRLASAILMPKCMVKILLARTPYRCQFDWAQIAGEKISATFNVSYEAAFYRLKELHYIERYEKLPQR